MIFTCTVVRVVDLEVTKTQTAEEFHRKVNVFITRRSDHSECYLTTHPHSRQLQSGFARMRSHKILSVQDILSRSPSKALDGVVCERGLSRMSRKPLKDTWKDTSYLSAAGDKSDQVLTSNFAMWGQDQHRS